MYRMGFSRLDSHLWLVWSCISTGQIKFGYAVAFVFLSKTAAIFPVLLHACSKNALYQQD